MALQLMKRLTQDHYFFTNAEETEAYHVDAAGERRAVDHFGQVLFFSLDNARDYARNNPQLKCWRLDYVGIVPQSF